MASIRIPVFFAALAVCAIASSGMTSSEIADAQTSHSLVSTRVSTRRAPQHPAQQSDGVLSAPSFNVSGVISNRISVGADSAFSFGNAVENNTQDTIRVYFSRTYTYPAGWQTSVCWGSDCYLSTVDSAVAVIPPHGQASLSLDVDPALNDLPDTALVTLRIGVPGSPADTASIYYWIGFQPKNPPLVFDWPNGMTTDTIFYGSGTFNFGEQRGNGLNLIENDLGTSNNYTFKIQDSLPKGWSLNTCIGTSCTEGDSLQVLFPALNQILNDGTLWELPVKFSLDVPTLSAADSAIIYLHVLPATSVAADTAVYRFAIQVQPQNGVNTPAVESAGLAVTNAWPNPLHPSTMLHLEILSDAAGPAIARIYDLDGTQKESMDLGQLNAGANDIQLSLPDRLPSGDYIIRVSQGASASEIVRISYLK